MSSRLHHLFILLLFVKKVMGICSKTCLNRTKMKGKIYPTQVGNSICKGCVWIMFLKKKYKVKDIKTDG
ncbi:hypothetical protein AAHE18_10G154600 [Arachis hypogaea]